MKLLRETIRRIILESAALVDDQVIALMEKEDLIFVVSMSPPHSGVINLLRRIDYDEEYGDFAPEDAMGKIHLGGTRLEDTMQITFSTVVPRLRKKGFGKLLYNVALMACSDENLWLVADRNTVSSRAQRIWQTWIKYPELYEMEQMDHVMIDGDSFLTGDEEDDMVQNSFSDYQWEQKPRTKRLPDEAYKRIEMSDGRFFTLEKDSWFFYSPDYKKQYLDSGLTKRFKMKDVDGFIKDLEDNNLLHRIR